MEYYGFVRHEIAPMLPAHADRVLELGCGNGATLAWLKANGRCNSTTGIEYSPDASSIARQHLDHVIEGDAEQIDLQALGQFDLILCLDVLEHLRDPWQMLRKLKQQLTPQGRIIVSVPNIRHHSILLPLLFRGQWRYQAAGILDQTHLRFFTQESAQQLLEQAGFQIEQCTGLGQQWAASRFWRWLGKLAWAKPFCSVQYILNGKIS
ncbi:class I SAM-dependent methyltransferase [Chitinibacter bivalviorum]|uniref:Class I SAM-dependent methyltransferase n=1 Tax=Chitinibacter bivalviorum TaxID=2739434 RepID=A0A7H9BGF6_9NEIS|nr:class I SAM-dependent methyltransferase [Chitinibacter bivalviorum]QLG87800.1 class I SAM-dependent methyltransferase [Chitinibacter bivalviorum]